ncbi:hypothetical protein AB0A60_33775 [Streptomyces sp. NPDC046275]|uniref:hypothetical protein n=1 Tax=Streptomyces sp. NPDC046275 TaxID=3157201 RepID=UPI0033E73160
MPAITRIDQIPPSHTIFPASSHPDLQHPGAVHHGWNTGRQLLLHAVGSPLATPMTCRPHQLRQQAIMQLRALTEHLDDVAGPLTLALHVCAVQQPLADADTTTLIPWVGEALADLGDWGVRAPLPDHLDLITRAVQAMQPCMPH